MGATNTFEATFDSQAGPIGGFIARPAAPGRYPAVILLSGIGGMQPQYRVVAEQFAEERIVGVGLDWMMREKDPADGVVLQDIDACVAYLKAQDYVDPGRLCLSGYCRGGTLALLGLGQRDHFNAGIIFECVRFYV
jgi:carboxymethylenebutenolidase